MASEEGKNVQDGSADGESAGNKTDETGEFHDEELLQEFKELIDAISRRVVAEAVEPEITQAARGFRQSATGAQRDFETALERLEAIAAEVEEQRESFRTSFLGALDEVFVAQRTALDTLASDTWTALQTASAVSSTKKFEQTVTAASDLAVSLRKAQETNVKQSEALVREVEERLNALHEQVKERQVALDASVEQQGIRLESMSTKIEELSQNLGGLGGYVDVFNEKSSELILRHDRFVTNAEQQRRELSSEHEVRSGQLRWLFRSYLAAAIVLVLIVVGGTWYGLTHLSLQSPESTAFASAFSEGTGLERRVGPASVELAPVGAILAGGQFGPGRCIGYVGRSRSGAIVAPDETSAGEAPSDIVVEDAPADDSTPRAVRVHGDEPIIDIAEAPTEGTAVTEDPGGDTLSRPGESAHDQHSVTP